MVTALSLIEFDISFFFICAAICYAFSALCIICDEYLVPAVEVFIVQFDVPEEVAAVTLVAFGSAAPELFLNSVSAVAETSDLSLSAILGSGLIAFGLIPPLCLLGVRRDREFSDRHHAQPSPQRKHPSHRFPGNDLSVEYGGEGDHDAEDEDADGDDDDREDGIGNDSVSHGNAERDLEELLRRHHLLKQKKCSVDHASQRKSGAAAEVVSGATGFTAIDQTRQRSEAGCIVSDDDYGDEAGAGNRDTPGKMFSNLDSFECLSSDESPGFGASRVFTPHPEHEQVIKNRKRGGSIYRNSPEFRQQQRSQQNRYGQRSQRPYLRQQGDENAEDNEANHVDIISSSNVDLDDYARGTNHTYGIGNSGDSAQGSVDLSQHNSVSSEQRKTQLVDGTESSPSTASEPLSLASSLVFSAPSLPPVNRGPVIRRLSTNEDGSGRNSYEVYTKSECNEHNIHSNRAEIYGGEGDSDMHGDMDGGYDSLDERKKYGLIKLKTGAAADVPGVASGTTAGLGSALYSSIMQSKAPASAAAMFASISHRAMLTVGTATTTVAPAAAAGAGSVSGATESGSASAGRTEVVGIFGKGRLEGQNCMERRENEIEKEEGEVLGEERGSISDTDTDSDVHHSFIQDSHSPPERDTGNTNSMLRYLTGRVMGSGATSVFSDGRVKARRSTDELLELGKSFEVSKGMIKEKKKGKITSKGVDRLQKLHSMQGKRFGSSDSSVSKAARKHNRRVRNKKLVKLKTFPIIRECGFYLLGLSIFLVAIQDGQIATHEACAFVAVYAVYVCMVVRVYWQSLAESQAEENRSAVAREAQVDLEQEIIRARHELEMEIKNEIEREQRNDQGEKEEGKRKQKIEEQETVKEQFQVSNPQQNSSGLTRRSPLTLNKLQDNERETFSCDAPAASAASCTLPAPTFDSARPSAAFHPFFSPEAEKWKDIDLSNLSVVPHTHSSAKPSTSLETATIETPRLPGMRMTMPQGSSWIAYNNGRQIHVSASGETNLLQSKQSQFPITNHPRGENSTTDIKMGTNFTIDPERVIYPLYNHGDGNHRSGNSDGMRDGVGLRHYRDHGESTSSGHIAPKRSQGIQWPAEECHGTRRHSPNVLSGMTITDLSEDGAVDDIDDIEVVPTAVNAPSCSNTLYRSVTELSYYFTVPVQGLFWYIIPQLHPQPIDISAEARAFSESPASTAGSIDASFLRLHAENHSSEYLPQFRGDRNLFGASGGSDSGEALDRLINIRYPAVLSADRYSDDLEEHDVLTSVSARGNYSVSHIRLNHGLLVENGNSGSNGGYWGKGITDATSAGVESGDAKRKGDYETSTYRQIAQQDRLQKPAEIPMEPVDYDSSMGHVNRMRREDEYSGHVAVSGVGKPTPVQVPLWKAIFVLLESILIIGVIASIVVSLCKMIMTRLHIGGATVGATLVAMGAEIPDVMSAIALAKSGYYDGAIAGAIGSQVINISLGVGVPALFVCLSGDGFLQIQHNQTDNLVLLASLLFVVIGAYAAVTLPLRRMMQKRCSLVPLHTSVSYAGSVMQIVIWTLVYTVYIVHNESTI